jgi:hypothetical protein
MGGFFMVDVLTIPGSSMYRVISLKERQPCCGCCKFARFDTEGFWYCLEGVVYTENGAEVEPWAVCDMHVHGKPEVLHEYEERFD